MMDRERKRRWILIGLLIAGVLLRVGMIWFPRSADDDTAVYAELGSNLLHHGTYGFTADDGTVGPTLIRLPGYPLFLAILGADKDGHNMWLVEAVQAALDLLGCWLLARFLWQWSGQKSGDVGLGLGCLCVFTAAYAAEGMTESLSVFAVAWGLWGVGQMMLGAEPGWRPALAVAGAAGLAMLLRPDGALLTICLLFAVVWYGSRRWGWTRSLRMGGIVALLAVVPLVPWTVRNWRTFHVFQPLAPRHVNDPGEPVNYGFYRWMRTWSAEYVHTGTIFWGVGTDKFELTDLPPWAYDSPQQERQTEKLFAIYNKDHNVSAQLDAQFGQLADERIKAHPIEYYVGVPALRVADMWLRPRTESYHIDVYWWHWRAHPLGSMEAVGLGFLNLAYVGLAIAGLRRRFVPFARWMILYIVLRSLMLATLENPEPRYTLQAYPILIVCAACWIGGRFGGRWKLHHAAGARDSDLAELFAESFPMVEGGGLEQMQAGVVGRDAGEG